LGSRWRDRVRRAASRPCARRGRRASPTRRRLPRPSKASWWRIHKIEQYGLPRPRKGKTME
jgi:hypothetical protein